ncbi:hypothetical protein BD408DRAFT_443428 [Parasitella parasitica]|nr:hypothetical protein BD408DRAFT_443428 [Parasitella parasitica]
MDTATAAATAAAAAATATAPAAAAAAAAANTVNVNTAYSPLNLYTNSNRIIQQVSQAQYQHHCLTLNQAQFYNANSHSNPPSNQMWDKQQLQPKPGHLGANDEFDYMSQHFRNHYYPYNPNTTRNIKTEDEPLLFVGSAAEHSKMTTNNDYRNNSPQKQQGFLENDPKNSSAAVDDEACNEEEENEENDEDDNHAIKRSTNTSKRNAGEKKKYRRESHNAVERRRRNNINDNIRNLGLLLPENMCQGKLNKGTILRSSVMYIHMLNDQLFKYKERLENLKYEAATLDPSLLNQYSQLR